MVIKSSEYCGEDSEDCEVIVHDHICLRSPNNTLWKFTVDNEGNLSVVEVT
jgi:hypothetical protein